MRKTFLLVIHQQQAMLRNSMFAFIDVKLFLFQHCDILRGVLPVTGLVSKIDTEIRSSSG